MLFRRGVLPNGGGICRAVLARGLFRLDVLQWRSRLSYFPSQYCYEDARFEFLLLR